MVELVEEVVVAAAPNSIDSICEMESAVGTAVEIADRDAITAMGDHI